MAKILWTLGRGFVSAASTNVYAGLGDNAGLSTDSDLYGTEERTEITCRSAGNASEIYTTITANARTSTTTLTLRKNSTDTDLQISIGSGVTGDLSDTGSADYSDGDTYCLEFATGTGTDFMTVQNVSIVYTPTSGSAKQVAASEDDGLGGSGAATFYINPLGDNNSGTTETNAIAIAPVEITFSDLQIYIRENGRSTSTTFTFRDNGADGNQTISVGSGVTGALEDTTNSDTVSAGDYYSVKMARGTGTGNFNLTHIGVTQTTDGSGSPISTSSFYSSSTTEYCQAWGDCDDFTSESDTDHLFPFDMDLEDLSAYVTSNSSTSTTNIDLRINGADGNQTIAVGSGVTGALQDTTNTDSISADDLVNYQVSGQNATIQISSIAMFATESGDAGSGNPWYAYAQMRR